MTSDGAWFGVTRQADLCVGTRYYGVSRRGQLFDGRAETLRWIGDKDELAQVTVLVFETTTLHFHWAHDAAGGDSGLVFLVEV